MPLDARAILYDPVILGEVRRGWQDSNPGIKGGHEEGGFILQDVTGELSVVRWPKGAQNTIVLPPHSNCKIRDNEIVATFHTHPNIGSGHLQEPSETDKRAVRDDPDLKGMTYVGEFVICQQTIYLITPSGQAYELGNAEEAFSEG